MEYTPFGAMIAVTLFGMCRGRILTAGGEMYWGEHERRGWNMS